MVELVTLAWQVALVAAFSLTGIQYLRDPTGERRDVVLMFATLIGLVVIDWSQALLGVSVPYGSEAAILLLLAHPYMLLRVVHHMHPVPRWARSIVLGGMGVSWALYLGASGGSRGVLLALVGVFFVASEAYAAALLFQGARTRAGAARTRLGLAAGGTVFLGVAILIVSVLLLVEGGVPVLEGLTGPLLAVGFVSYYLGFAPPRRLARAWEIRAFQRIVAEPVGSASMGERVGASLDRFRRSVDELLEPRASVLIVREGEQVRVRREPDALRVPEDPRGKGGLVERCWSSGSVVVDREGEGLSGWEVDAAEQAQAGAVMAVPLALGDRCHGVCLAFLRRAPIFADEIASLLVLVGEDVAKDLEMSRLAEQREQERLKAIEAEKEALEEANRLKSQFLANTSHEIRTPMNTIIGLTSLLLDEEEDVDKRQDLETIEASGEHLLNLINDLLDISKIEAGQLDLHMEPTDLRASAEESMDLVVPSASMKDIDLVYKIEEGTPERVETDPNRLKQVLVNLLSNAVKFTEEGHVTLTVHLEEDRGEEVLIGFQVTDTGTGIPEGEIEGLVEPFTQVDATATREHEGTGLGLAISHELVGMMGGSMTIESTEGEGTRVAFTLEAQTTDEPVARSWSLGVEDLEDTRVLIVDDNEASRRILAETMTRWGMTTTTLSEPKQALKLDDEEDFDLIVLDYSMPQTTGLELAQRMQDHEAYEGLPILMVTSMPGAREKAQPPIEQVLVKPIKPSILYDALVTVLAGTPRHRVHKRQDRMDPELADRLGIRVLVAEDSDTNRIVVTRILAKHGFEPETAISGQDCLEKLRQDPRDVVLMDVQMPVMDGFEATREIRATLPDADQPRIIALTAHAAPEVREKAQEAGMDDYLAKPIQPEQLRDALRKAVNVDEG